MTLNYVIYIDINENHNNPYYIQKQPNNGLERPSCWFLW